MNDDQIVETLFAPLETGDLQLRNRIAMAPMTRHRCELDGTPTDLVVEHYRQRAAAGLIVTEGIYPCDMGRGYLFTPGLVTDRHIEGWKRVTDAVHAEGGTIFAQIMHVGRLSDPLMLPNGSQPLAPSAVRPDPTSRAYTINCPRPRRPYPAPKELTVRQVEQVVDDFRACAINAREAGFDGVEIHAASGYLPMQFLCTNTNRRTDRYGGNVPGRARFLLDCVDAIAQATGPQFVAVKVSPGWEFHDVRDEDPLATYTYVAQALSERDIAYLQVGNYGMDWDVLGAMRKAYRGTLMAVAGFDRRSAASAIAAGRCDMVAFGQAYIANPDLEARLRKGLPLTRPDVSTFYTQGEQGYSDYPVYSQTPAEWLLDADASFKHGTSRKEL
tara:strand:+ start:6221 stop:7378 length:1158 start_codon:yes stop_codon:yes gene_type:complete